MIIKEVMCIFIDKKSFSVFFFFIENVKGNNSIKKARNFLANAHVKLFLDQHFYFFKNYCLHIFDLFSLCYYHYFIS